MSLGLTNQYINFAHLLLSLAQHTHGPHVDALAQLVLCLLQPLHAFVRLLRVLLSKVVRCVWLAEVFLLLANPAVLLQQGFHLLRRILGVFVAFSDLVFKVLDLQGSLAGLLAQTLLLVDLLVDVTIA